MALYNYPTINVSGRGNLKVYAIDFSAATTDSPGRASVTYIDKDNNLTPPTLSVSNPTFISIGSLNFKGYPIKYKKSLSSEGESLLTVEYIDGSFILDQYNIGLFGKYVNASIPIENLLGPQKIQNRGLTVGGLNSFHIFNGNSSESNTSSVPSWMIFVGKSVDPCHAAFEALTDDPCNPCPQPENSIAKQASAIDCNKLRSQEILKVDYSFNELLDALKTKGIQISISAQYNENYRAQFTGSLRDVLRTWCSIFSLSFYFENDKIYIYDVSSGVNLNVSFSDSIVLNKTEESSIEHTKATSSILYYAQAGVDKNYNCSNKHGKKILCRPLTIKDLGAKGLRNDYGCSSDRELYNLIEFMSTFSSYDSTLREMMAWFEVYGITDANAAKSLVSSSKTSSKFGDTKFGGYHQKGLDDDKNKNTYSLPLLSMTIKAVYDKNSPEFKQLLSGSSLDDSIKARAASNYEPYFFIASQNEARYASMINWENSIGQGFLGRYYIRWYENYSSSSSPDILSCQGDDAKFYKQGSSSLDFSSFMPSLDSETSPEFGFDPTKLKRAKNYTSLPIYKFNSNQGKVKDSFILVNRSIIWSPPLASEGIIKKVMDLAGPHRPIQLGLASSFGDFINKHPAAKDAPFSDRDMLWIGFKMASGFNVSTSNVNHPTDQAFGTNCETYISTFSTPVDLGLKSKRCTRINIGQIGAIHMPPQSRVNDSTDGGYSVYVSDSRSVDYYQAVPKMESVVSSYRSGKVLANEVNYNNSINLDKIKTTQFDKITNNCLPNYQEITNRMNVLVNNMASLNELASKSITYEIAGLPNSNFTPSDGLVSLSVRVGSKGASSTLSFSDLRNRTIPKSETLLEFEQITNNVISNFSPTHHINQNLLSLNVRDNTIDL